MPFISVEAADSLITNTSALSQALMNCRARQVPVDTNLLNTTLDVICSVLESHLIADVHGISGTAANEAAPSAASDSHLNADVISETTLPLERPVVDAPGDAPLQMSQPFIVDAGSKRIHPAARKSTTPQPLLRALPKFCRKRVPRSPPQGPRRDEQRLPSHLPAPPPSPSTTNDTVTDHRRLIPTNHPKSAAVDGKFVKMKGMPTEEQQQRAARNLRAERTIKTCMNLYRVDQIIAAGSISTTKAGAKCEGLLPLPKRRR